MKVAPTHNNGSWPPTARQKPEDTPSQETWTTTVWGGVIFSEPSVPVELSAFLRDQAGTLKLPVPISVVWREIQHD